MGWSLVHEVRKELKEAGLGQNNLVDHEYEVGYQ